MKCGGKLYNPMHGQRGMALISALLLLLVVSLLAVGLSMDSSMDVRVAGYQRATARAIANTESGLIAASDILEDNIFSGGWPSAGAYPNLSAQYVGSINIVGDPVFYMNKNTGEATIMTMTGEINANITTQYLDAVLAKGGAIQIAAGYGGAGKGAAGGGSQILYNIQAAGSDVSASGTALSTRNLGLNYRYVTK